MISRLRNLLPRFGADARGNTAVIFAIALLPTLGLIGAAYDYTRASSIRTAMQAAVDVTALKLAQNASTNSNLSKDANTYFLAVFTNTAAQSPSATATYSNTNGGNVVVSATATYPPLFGGIFNMLSGGTKDRTIALAVNSTANWSTARLRVALVLDNTGSMSQNSKLTTLQSALTSTSSSSPGLLAQLKAAATSSADVYVSIIPFVKDSNIDPVNNTQSWIDWTGWEAEPANLAASKPTSNPNWNQVGPNSACPFTSNTGSSNYMGFVCTDLPGSAATKTISTIQANGLICPGALTTDPNNSSKKIPMGDDGAGKYKNNPNTTHSYSLYNGCYDSTTTCTGASCTCPTGATCTTTGSGSSKTVTINPTNPAYYFHTWRPTTPVNSPATPAHSTWNGCVTDRGTSTAPGTNAGNDETVAAPSTGDVTTYYPAEQYYVCPQASMGLNNNWSSMTTLVNNMVAAGNTNQAIGLQLGWMSLVGSGPFTAIAMDPNYTYQQYIILLTDGLNTQDRWYGTSTNCGQGNTALVQSPNMCMDQREAQLCDNIKSAGITIYAIQVNTSTPPDATSKLLQYCAGSKPKQGDSSAFWLLTSASEMTATFNAIGQQISKLHIAK